MKTESEVRLEKEQLKTLLPELQSRILGQDAALHQIVPLLQMGEFGLRDPRRPKGSFLFLGPTGVGKTETALAFTQLLFGDDQVIRLDMSEYKTADQLAQLLGTPQATGQLEREYDRCDRNATLLLDEIEKAHPLFFDLLLQILDAARLTTGSGRILDLHRYYVVMTSNLGSEALLKANSCSQVTRERFLETQACRAFRPETFARIDETVVFHHLNYEVCQRIGKQAFDLEQARLAKLGHSVALSADETRELIQSSFDPRYGARFTVRKITRFLQERASEAIFTAS